MIRGHGIRGHGIRGHGISCTWLPTRGRDVVRVSEEMVVRTYTFCYQSNTPLLAVHGKQIKLYHAIWVVFHIPVLVDQGSIFDLALLYH